jgi:phenylalanyl-tRNA synthetase beta chain
MLCSARELKLADDHAACWLASNAPWVDIRVWLKLDDTIFTLKLTPNLAHCLSVYGIAREVAALTGSPLKTPPTIRCLRARCALPVRGPGDRSVWPLLGRVVRNVTPRRPRRLDGRPPGPLRPAQRDGAGGHLELRDVRVWPPVAHLRSGQDPRQGLTVRWGRTGETLKLLNGNTIEVDAQVSA